MHAPKVLYVLADGGRVRFVERGSAGDFTTVRQIESGHIHERAHDLGRAPPARVQESVGAMRHAIEPRQDPRAKLERAFIAGVSNEMNSEESLLSYDMLVIAAPPRLISQFHKHLSGMLLAKLQTCINKDLTKIPDKELSPHLPVLFARRASAS